MREIIGLAVLAADIWAVLNIAQSKEKDGAKALWILAVLVLPVVGLAVWYFAGPKK
jgi:Phospholipase_D-nuclease N-terminal